MRKQHPNMAYALKRTRRAIEQEINERALRLGEEASDTISQLMVEYCRNLLIQRAEPAPQSMGTISMIAESIHTEKASGNEEGGRAVFNSTKNNKKRFGGRVMKVPMDKNKLVMFLEYGTGLEGQSNPHPDASSFGWEYAINDGKVKEVNKKYGYIENDKLKARKIFRNQEWYVDKFGRRGFIFRYRGKEYLDSKDIVFKNTYNEDGPAEGSYALKYIQPKKGKQKPYWRRNRVIEGLDATKKMYAFSSGLKPLRFIYDTRKNGLPEIIKMLREEYKQ
jgi:hypothetical protein